MYFQTVGLRADSLYPLMSTNFSFTAALTCYVYTCIMCWFYLFRRFLTPVNTILWSPSNHYKGLNLCWGSTLLGVSLIEYTLYFRSPYFRPIVVLIKHFPQLRSVLSNQWSEIVDFFTKVKPSNSKNKYNFRLAMQNKVWYS